MQHLQKTGGGGLLAVPYRVSATKIISGESPRIGDRSKSPYSAATLKPQRASRCSTSNRKKYRSGQANTSLSWRPSRCLMEKIISTSFRCSARWNAVTLSLMRTRLPSAVSYSVSGTSRMCTGSCMRSASVWRKMFANALQAIHLLPHFQQVLEWPKRNDNQPEFFAEVEPRHVPLHKVNTFPRFYAERRPFFHRALQHAPGKIKPGNPLSCFRQRHGDSSCPATQL